jgi:hypothetical protein
MVNDVSKAIIAIGIAIGGIVHVLSPVLHAVLR